MSHKYFCEFCGQRFHSPVAAIECARMPACRGFGFPPAGIVGSWKVRGCPIILARTAAELLQKSPAGQTIPRVKEMGDNIIKWARRTEEALCANTPLSLGKRTRVHNGLVDFVWGNVWKKGTPLPNIHALDLARRYAFDAKIFIQDRLEDGLCSKFWFEDEHPEWLLYDVINVPLAVYVTKLKDRGMVNKELDAGIKFWGARDQLRDIDPPEGMLGQMLEHCWRDELRSWNYMIGALDTAMRWIEKNGTAASLDLSDFDTDEAYEKLLAYIWDDRVDEKPLLDLKLWLVNDRFWVAAEKRAEAKEILTKESGHIAKSVKGVPLTKKLYDEKGREVETAGDLLARFNKPQFIGVA